MESYNIPAISHVWPQSPVEDDKYYHINLLGTEDGRIELWYTTWFVDYTDSAPRRSLFVARPIMPLGFLSHFRDVQQPAVLVNDTTGYSLYRRYLGGHAIIREALVAALMPHLLLPVETVESFTRGRLYPEELEPTWLHRAPTKKTRMQIIKRDGFRCRICGRRPDDYIDIELHVHHIHPWAQGGLTERENLITLCHTCHGGLDPHFDHQLYELIGAQPSPGHAPWNAEYLAGVERYRQLVAQAETRANSEE